MIKWRDPEKNEISNIVAYVLERMVNWVWDVRKKKN